MKSSSLFVMGALVTTTVLGSCVDQPETQCFAAIGAFTARFDKVSGDCDEELTRAIVGTQTYVTNPTKPGDHINSVAIQLEEAGLFIDRGELEDPVVAPAAGQKPYALGKFETRYPNGNNLCEVPELSVAEVTMDAIPERATEEDADEDGEPDVIPAQEAIDVRYQWTNLKVYVTAANTGTQWGADLEYTRNGCTAKYKVSAVTAISCTNLEGELEPEKCAERGGDYGPLECDPDLGACVLLEDFPSFN